MNRTNFIFIKLKNLILPFSFVLFTLFLVIFSESNLTAAKSGLALFANSVLPSLLPFFIATELLGYTNVIDYLGKLLDRLMRPLFNVPGIGAFALVMGIISGYPIGAKIVTNLRQDNLLTKAEGERLLAFSNNSGPLFIISAVGISLFGSVKIGVLLLLSHILACLSVGIVFRFWKKRPTYTRASGRAMLALKQKDGAFVQKINKNSVHLFKQSATFANLGEILSKSISSAISSVVMIGGFVVLFSVIVSMLESTKILQIASIPFYPICNILHIDYNLIPSFFSGIVELTNGVKNIALISTGSTNIKLLISSFLLGFGGLSVALQVLGIISKTDISIKPYLLGKLLQGLFSAIFTYFLL